MQTSKIRIYGANWCGDCRRAKLFMNDYGIEYEWIDTDQSKDAEDIVRTLNHGKRIIPTIILGLQREALVWLSQKQLGFPA